MLIRTLSSLVISVLICAMGVLPLVVGAEETPAADDALKILQLQTGGSGSGTASEEVVLIYNSANTDVEVTGLCLHYSSAAQDPSDDESTTRKLACIEPEDEEQLVELWLPAQGIVSFATNEFIAVHSEFHADGIYSAGLASSGGHVWIVDAGGAEHDRIGWGAAVAPEGSPALAADDGDVLSRDYDSVADTDDNQADFYSLALLETIMSSIYEIAVEVDICANLDGVQTTLDELGSNYLVDDDGNCHEDVCVDIDGLQLVAPDGYVLNEETGVCELIPLEDAALILTELLINAPSYDTGNEFIEIYNPHSRTIELSGYQLQLGLSYTKTYTFTTGSIGPNEFVVISDTQSGIILPNTSASSVRLVAPAGNVVSDTEVYSNAGDDVSWSLVDDIWIYTNQITRGSANEPYVEPVVEEVLGTTTVYAPCAPGKYRNPETNRCKNIESAVSRLVPCAAGQVRNPDTNRCRSVASTASSSLVPCKEGQERNPETNRCRNIPIAGDVSGLASVTDVVVETREGQLNWLVIFATGVATVSYMAYEWRSEISYKMRQLQARRA